MLGRRRCCCATCSPLKVCVAGCNGLPLAGASVSIAGVGSCTTVLSGSTACCSLPIPAAGSYTITTAIAGYPTDTVTRSVSCGGTTTINLAGVTPSSGNCCCPSLAFPIPTTLFLTVCGVTATLVNTPSSGVCNNFSGWNGTALLPATVADGLIGTSGACAWPGTATATGTVLVTFFARCPANTTTITVQAVCNLINNVQAGGTVAALMPSGMVGWDCVGEGGQCAIGVWVSGLPPTFNMTGTIAPGSISTTGTFPSTMDLAHCGFLSPPGTIAGPCAGAAVTLTN